HSFWQHPALRPCTGQSTNSGIHAFQLLLHTVPGNHHASLSSGRVLRQAYRPLFDDDLQCDASAAVWEGVDHGLQPVKRATDFRHAAGAPCASTLAEDAGKGPGVSRLPRGAQSFSSRILPPSLRAKARAICEPDVSRGKNTGIGEIGFG